MLYAVTRSLVSAEAACTEQIVQLVSSTQTLRGAGLTVIASNRHAELDYAEIPDIVAAAQADHRHHQAFPIESAGQRLTRMLFRTTHRRGPNRNHFRNECVRGRLLHGGKVTQPTDTDRAHGCLSARPLVHIGHWSLPGEVTAGVPGPPSTAGRGCGGGYHRA
jgi:hypothetical protein